jgi:hypothetical protein
LFCLVFISTTQKKGKNMIFDHLKFTNAVKSIHLKPNEILTYESIPDSEVRRRLDEFIDCGKNSRFSAALDEICKNLVGRTMFKVLMTKMEANGILRARSKIKIMEQDNKKKGSAYSETIFGVKINFDRYEPSGVGIPEKQYYCLDKAGKIQTKLKSLVGSLFHEFCHALHDISGTHISKEKNVLCLKDTPLWKVWGNDEELRSITCFNNDPICDHSFDLCQSILKGESFLPRYAHNIGYKSIDLPTIDDQKRKKLLQFLPLSQKFMDGWKEYVL